ncbi:GNAT family N-acetyltransferase [Flavivirga jejuensis]|uniref:GNAT family N-acetyltransferase n=1 Tax=Flavivirga jejuensis TaxID=870487 RepID=A0ABT8WRN3_9FLAO|nr:GNAT family N-acetyltransferase [Flavivirga jejuensis]MDO5975813.1 GNAT family N-acetyltransferase [Flavivirga jejuensis]
MDTHKKISDITFIGSGISTSFSIINFLDQVDNQAIINDRVSINIIEKYSEFNLGIPYGSRSGFSTLLITSLRNFLIEPELSLFIKWLNKNKTWLLDAFEKEGGILSKEWLSNNEEAISNNNWEDLFIPRRFFGCYINLRVNNKIEALKEKGLIDVNFISGEVIDIEKDNNIYEIVLQDGSEISTQKVVLSVGSLPINYLWQNKHLIEKKNLMFVNNPYKPELGVVLDKLNNFINNRNGETTNILIVGANASALELIYKLNDCSKTKRNNTNFTFLSTQGTVPDALINEEKLEGFIPNHLNKLKEEKNITAKLIAEATFKDLDYADEINLGPASTVYIISKYFGVLLETLSVKELEIFACQYGNEIGKRQRCAGLHYSNVITELEKQNRFEHISGRFNNLESDFDGNYNMEYIETSTKNKKTHNKHFHIVINCVGSKNLSHDDIPILHQNLIKKGYCTPNESKIGFYVNDSLEANKNLHIMGPMLAGNVIENKPVWHVEHCGRIIWLSKVLSKIIADDLFQDKDYTPKKYKLEINSLNNDLDIIKYKKILKENWNNNIYYAYDHLKYFENETNSLKYFLFKVNDSSQIFMPIILRQVKSNETDSQYFDAITPYGYSGPLYNDQITELDLKEFWKAVDNWYKENNIITEFIRFSLNKNYLGYSGLLISSLLNVKGKLYHDFENQWLSFSSKVRNNYRKAVSYNLNIKILNSNDINEEHIKTFFDIYTDTMIRHDAKSIYFFSSDYFKNLILNNLDEFTIAIVYLDDIAISTELIIKNDNTVFAFLGGTDANYYKYRPNDFLRVEIIKWAIKNNYKHYVLGGGLKDNDGLHKSKKALFPKDEDVTFYTGRKIIDYEAYDKLCENHLEDYGSIHKEELKNYFFPLYRFQNR